MKTLIVTAWYSLKNKFNNDTYYKWIKNFLTNCNHDIIIYTNIKSYKEHINKYENYKNIKIILKEIDSFKTYKYTWEYNHKKNYLLNNKICSELNMLWNEKINFVYEASQVYKNKYDYYIWSDIGYFRDSNFSFDNWAFDIKLDNNKIHYGQICDNNFINYLAKTNVIPHNQVSIAGGFFIAHNSKIKWWYDIYYTKLENYFNNNKLIKDDQIIIIDCIINNLEHFELHIEDNKYLDNWFMFQRKLKIEK